MGGEEIRLAGNLTRPRYMRKLATDADGWRG